MQPACAARLRAYVRVLSRQVEGRKEWRFYRPLLELPRSCSGDLPANAIGEPELVVELGPGDVLYFPRGWVHQARAVAGGGHSLHLTVSTFQGHCWADLLSTAVGIAGDASLELRRGLPTVSCCLTLRYFWRC
jgi:lysine-specific demethylase/histidyl-hydroxylase NO66